jgi:hypothetical protein
MVSSRSALNADPPFTVIPVPWMDFLQRNYTDSAKQVGQDTLNTVSAC